VPCRAVLCCAVQVLINAGILVAYCSGIPYELGCTGFDVLGGVWCSWWRVMITAGLLPAALQVGGFGWLCGGGGKRWMLVLPLLLIVTLASGGGS